MDELKFTANEQNCLAMVCELLASVHHSVNVNPEEYKEEELIRDAEKFAEIVDRFNGINWGNLYDKFHRQGMNR